MRWLYFALHKNKDHVLFILLLVLSVTILFSGHSLEINQLRIRVGEFFSFTELPSTWLSSKRILSAENSRLREKNMQLKLLLESVLNLESENQQLRSLLEFKKKVGWTLVPASVHGKGVATTVTSFKIDVGRQDGVQVNNPVVIGDGVVGKTYLVGETTSLVQLISDPDFRLSVKINPSGAVGILSWLESNRCEIKEIPKSASIKIGDLVYTSNYSDIYPPNLPVGKVVAIYDERGSFQKRLTLETFFNIGTLQYVFVIIDDERE